MHSASRGGHFRQILILLEKFLNHLDDWFRSLFMCLKLSNTSKHIFSQRYSIFNFGIVKNDRKSRKKSKLSGVHVHLFFGHKNDYDV